MNLTMNRNPTARLLTLVSGWISLNEVAGLTVYEGDEESHFYAVIDFFEGDAPTNITIKLDAPIDIVEYGPARFDPQERAIVMSPHKRA